MNDLENARAVQGIRQEKCAKLEKENKLLKARNEELNENCYGLAKENKELKQMQEVWIGDKKTGYFYESFVNDVQKRDMKYRELKSRGYRDINVGQYVCATGETIYFIRRK